MYGAYSIKEPIEREPKFTPLPSTTPPPPAPPPVVTVPVPAPPPTPAPPAIVRSEPPPGYTWVDATPTVPGHWERLRAGQTAQGAPIELGPTPQIEVRTHDTAAEDTQSRIRRGVPTMVYESVINNNDALLHPLFVDALIAKGLNAAEAQATWEQHVRIDDNLIDARVSQKEDGNWHIDDALALELRDKGVTPWDWYIEQWYQEALSNRVEIAQAEAEKAAKENPQLPTLGPLPTQMPPRASSLNVAVVAVGLGIAIYLLGK